jgi:predicted ATP-grasp superfamily ATP-dependent carboligase
MTRIFVYEYLCAMHSGRPGESSPRAGSLLDEGRAMRDAAVADAARVDGADVRTLDATAEDEADFRRLAEWCDYALVIAPEFDGILEERVRWAEEAGAKLLGPGTDAVALCSDKLKLAEWWEWVGVPTPPTRTFQPDAFASPVVVKPRDGAGAGDTQVFLESPVGFVPSRPAVIQPYCAGTAASVSLLIGPRQTIAFPPARQILTRPPDISYEGGEWPIDHADAVPLARQAAAAVPGLRGFVGVDLVLGPPSVAIEINPRLTTSYVGLRALVRANLIDLLIRIVEGEPVEIPDVQPGRVRFDTRGGTKVLPAAGAEGPSEEL